MAARLRSCCSAAVRAASASEIARVLSFSTNSSSSVLARTPRASSVSFSSASFAASVRYQSPASSSPSSSWAMSLVCTQTRSCAASIRRRSSGVRPRGESDRPPPRPPDPRPAFSMAISEACWIVSEASNSTLPSARACAISASTRRSSRRSSVSPLATNSADSASSSFCWRISSSSRIWSMSCAEVAASSAVMRAVMRAASARKVLSACASSTAFL